jgi:hypothetical protein
MMYKTTHEAGKLEGQSLLQKVTMTKTIVLRAEGYGECQACVPSLVGYRQPRVHR